MGQWVSGGKNVSIFLWPELPNPRIWSRGFGFNISRWAVKVISKIIKMTLKCKWCHLLKSMRSLTTEFWTSWMGREWTLSETRSSSVFYLGGKKSDGWTIFTRSACDKNVNKTTLNSILNAPTEWCLNRKWPPGSLQLMWYLMTVSQGNFKSE